MLLQGLLCLPLGLLIYFSVLHHVHLMIISLLGKSKKKKWPRHGHSLVLLAVTLSYFSLKCSSWTVEQLTGVFSRSEVNYFKVLIFTSQTDIKMVYGHNLGHCDLGCYNNVHRKSKTRRVLS